MTIDSVAVARGPGEFMRGVQRGIPVLVAAAPFGLLFGTIAHENGFSTFEAVLMSATIFAGASQMVGLDLFGTKVAPWLIVLSIFAVNFRHVLYSATIGRHLSHWSLPEKIIGFFFLIDPQFAEAERRVEERKPITFAWYMGLGLPIYLSWVVETWLGALFGRFIPDPYALGIDFLLPIYFLGLVMGFRSRSMWLPVVATSGVASIVAFHLVGSPWHVSIGAMAGVVLAAFISPVPQAAEEGE